MPDFRQGFVRARINGEVVELDRPPALDLRRKHTIDVVVNRFKVRDDLGLRLGEGVARGSTAGEWWRRAPRPRSWPIPTR